MRIFGLLTLSALIGLTGCTSGSRGNDAMVSMSSGVGFGDYQRYLRAQEASHRSRAPYSVPPEQPRVATAAPYPTSATPPVAMASLPQPVATGAPMAAPLAPVTTAPIAQAPIVQAPTLREPTPLPSAPQQTASIAPQMSSPAFGTTPAFDAGPSVRPGGLSDEQDFAAVSARESIESDRERLAQQRAQYQIVEVDTVPSGAVRAGPNVFEFALATRHPVGTERYRRLNPLRWARWENNCLQFHNQDAAQEAFLAAGGPERDRENLDPDGDGYACWWDPAPIRQAVNASR